jgi:hypothetical protein
MIGSSDERAEGEKLADDTGKVNGRSKALPTGFQDVLPNVAAVAGLVVGHISHVTIRKYSAYLLTKDAPGFALCTRKSGYCDTVLRLRCTSDQ